METFTPAGEVLSLAPEIRSTAFPLPRAERQRVVIKIDPSSPGPVLLKFGEAGASVDDFDISLLPGEVRTFHTLSPQTHLASACPSGAARLYAQCGDAV